MAAGRNFEMVIKNITFVCNNPRTLAPRGFMNFGQILHSATPLLLLQVSVISCVAKLLEGCLRPLGQSTIVAQIFGGMVFGPSLFGHKKLLGNKLFPLRGMVVFETVASFGIMFFYFAIGVQMDASTVLHPERRAVCLGFSVFIITLALPSLLSLILVKALPLQTTTADSLPLIAASQAFTGFPVVAVLLSELKILNTDIGRLALSAGIYSDALGITYTAATLAFLGNNNSSSTVMPVLAISSAAALTGLIVFLFRPAIMWMRRRTSEGKSVQEGYVVTMFVMVLVTGILGELVGQHFVFGPLILGLVVPPGPPFGAGLMFKLESLASGLFYPTYLAVSGLQTDIYKLQLWGLVAVGIITVFACLVKIVVSMVVGYYGGLSKHEAFILGLIMNAKGIVELMVFNLWRQNKTVKDQEFSMLVISLLVVTGIIFPLIKFVYNPSSQYFMVKRNTIQHAKLESELKIQVCIENQESVPTIINLLEVSHSSEKSPLAIIGLVLVKLVGRTAPILIAHQPEDNNNSTNTTETSIQILNALRQYEERCGGTTVLQTFTSVSHFKWIHEDICRVAADKRANIVILPFHKRWAIDGSIGSMNRSIRNMNISVIKKAPCSVAILIDRGVLASTGAALPNQFIFHVACIFIGGEDDAESLAYGARMAKNESVDLTVVRFIHFCDIHSKERRRDSELIHEYRHANAGNDRFVIVEEMVKNAEGLSNGIRAMVDCFDLILVGRSHQDSPILEGMGIWSDCPELGVVGDMLASPEFGSGASVLVVQQQRRGGNNAVSRYVNKVDAALVHDVSFDDGGKTSWTITVDKK